MRHTKICTAEGDITQMPADALITAINLDGEWFGGIDYAIKKVAGEMYHAQAGAAMPLCDLQTVIARGTGNHRGKFRDVVFVVDDLQSPLNRVVYTGLEAASNEGYQHILVPTIRMGVMAGAREKSPKEAIGKMALGVRNFIDKYAESTSLEEIKFVVYNNPILARSLSVVLDRT
jgi:O-acetyl-ADP-ribose deacetylase (regulator of RNase III)